jgi:hypothetical protein
MRIKDLPLVEEIKQEYITLRIYGVGREDAVRELMLRYASELTLSPEDDGLVFWIGIADAQNALKELSKEVSEQGLYALQQIVQGEWNVAAIDLKRRTEWYGKAPRPEKKRIRAPKKFRCSWKIGDTFAYQLQGQDAEEFGLSGRYVLFRKVSEVTESNGAVVPIVTVTAWDDAPLPATSEEFMRLPILKLDNGRAHTPKDKFIYRTEMLIDSEKMLKQLNLQYLGNFPDVVMPEDEAVITYVGFMKKLALNLIDISCCHYCRNHDYYDNLGKANAGSDSRCTALEGNNR